MSPATPTNLWHRSGAASFLAGFRAAWLSALAYVVIGTYIGIAALTHDFGFGLWWAMASTVLVWAAPAQVILVSALATGGAPLATALAVGVSSARLLPMVMSLPPLIKRPKTSYATLILPAHLTAVSVWIEALRLLPAISRQERIPFVNGLGIGFMCAAHSGTLIGYYLAGSLPPLLSAGLLFLTPVSFLISTAQLPADVGLASACNRDRARSAHGCMAGRTRFALDGGRWRLACLWHPSAARGAQMTRIHL